MGWVFFPDSDAPRNRGRELRFLTSGLESYIPRIKFRTQVDERGHDEDSLFVDLAGSSGGNLALVLDNGSEEVSRIIFPRELAISLRDALSVGLALGQLEAFTDGQTAKLATATAQGARTVASTDLHTVIAPQKPKVATAVTDHRKTRRSDEAAPR
jgi:hypothetical protein